MTNKLNVKIYNVLILILFFGTEIGVGLQFAWSRKYAAQYGSCKQKGNLNHKFIKLIVNFELSKNIFL